MVRRGDGEKAMQAQAVFVAAAAGGGGPGPPVLPVCRRDHRGATPPRRPARKGTAPGHHLQDTNGVLTELARGATLGHCVRADAGQRRRHRQTASSSAGPRRC
ncbi:hypothetical protein ONE63_008105 [Megalurothrips usitatus]|uniref:Uncharacterized protein n=1 Tax=Megalurothrips usitatus TaxID=439358 RepID=A0AAV7XNR0_9NEOP|nr:hypothetical protein ONE63_008105 [Megalurothrips usitatus]